MGDYLAGVALQRRAAHDVLDRGIRLASSEPQVLDDELVPFGQAPGQFDGFATQAEAMALAKRSPEVAIVMRDGHNFHVFRTSATVLGDEFAPFDHPKGWQLVRS